MVTLPFFLPRRGEAREGYGHGHPLPLLLARTRVKRGDVAMVALPSFLHMGEVEMPIATPHALPQAGRM